MFRRAQVYYAAMALGILGRKLGMTQVNGDDGRRIAVTMIEAGPCLVMQKKSVERDGYAALKLAFQEMKAKRLSKAVRTQFEKLKTNPRRYIREFRVASDDLGKFEAGQEVTLEGLFAPGQLIDVVGRTKGRGFTGVVKRWGMKGNRASHGTHEFFRHAGAIGTRTWPGNVHKGKKMPGHYGDTRVTIQNLKVVSILKEQNCLLVEGAIPGADNAIVELRPSATRPSKASK